MIWKAVSPRLLSFLIILSGGETIIVGGLNRIRPGIPVKTVAYKDSSASSKPTASSN